MPQKIKSDVVQPAGAASPFVLVNLKRRHVPQRAPRRPATAAVAGHAAEKVKLHADQRPGRAIERVPCRYTRNLLAGPPGCMPVDSSSSSRVSCASSVVRPLTFPGSCCLLIIDRRCGVEQLARTRAGRIGHMPMDGRVAAYF